jgi:RNA polymerase sigma factor (sigma-70 family)
VVTKIADQVHRHLTHVPIEDLRQSGFVGLVEAADRYKRSAGIFEHYAYFRVRGAMIDAHKRRAYRDETHSSIEEKYDDGDPEHDRFKVVAIDRRPLPDATAARLEQGRLLTEAMTRLHPDERRVFVGALQGIPLTQTARECGRSVCWARAKMELARTKVGSRVLMWGLGTDRAA